MSRYSAILFDFDGVIARTMEDNFQAWSYALSSLGIDLEKEEYFLEEGRTSREYAKMILSERQAERNLATQIIKIKNDYYSQIHKFSLYDGVEEIVLALKKRGFKLGLVSGGSYARVCCENALSLLAHFDVIITGDDKLNGKPAPDPYLTAASRLGLSPQECLVVENAPLGIQAAKEAGMDCVAISSTLDPKFLAQADQVISDVREVKSIVRL